MLQGHGRRVRNVVLPGEHTARFLLIWTRRFRCKKCTATCSVLPPGVLPGHLYSLYAILTAWWLGARPPVGEGLCDEAVYARQGVDRLTPEAHHYGRPRWRSLPRWAGRIDGWWASRVVVGAGWRQRVESLLVGLQAQGGVDWVGHAIGGAAV